MFTSNINPDQIAIRIEKFRLRAEKGIKDSEIIDEITSIFGDAYSFPVEQRHFQKGTAFFRARAISNSDNIVPLRAIRTVSDAWEPPAEYIKTQGRLNAVGQGILYCCPSDPELAIDEARARNNNHVAVMLYQAIREIKVSVIGGYQDSNLPKDDSTKRFFKFLEEEFGRLVPKGHERRYSITRAVADTFFNYPEQDAWCYRSVQYPQKFNTAFFPSQAHQSLKLRGVMICDLRGSLTGQLRVKMVVDFDEISGEARYHPIGSDIQKLLFPEIE
jgi:hypothetical protein